MEEVKNAITRLEESVVLLETAIHNVKKTYRQTTEKSTELKTVVKTVYDRVDRILNTLKGED